MLEEYHRTGESPSMNFTVTTRVVLLLLCGSLPLMLAASHFTALVLFLGYNIFLLFLVYLDVLITPPPHLIEAVRQCPGKLSLGEENEVFLNLYNRSWKPLEFTVLDEFPIEFESSHKEMVVPLDKRTEARIKYHVKPLRRGNFLFGNIVVQYKGVLELVKINKIVPAGLQVKVYPNIKSISRFELTLRRSHLIESGLISERKRGTGTDFESLKEYTIGYEYRKIDLKATARKNKPITRDYQSEKNQSILVSIDCSRPMGVKVGNFTYLDFAVNAALLLGYLVTRREDKIGLLTFSDRIHAFLPPKRGKRQFYHFLEKLYDLQCNRVEPDFGNPFKFIIQSRVKRSLIILLTDFSAGAIVNKLRESAWLISRKHLLMVVSIINPAVREISRKVPDSIDEVFRKIVAQDGINKINTVKKDMENVGIMTLSLAPNELCSSLLANYISLKLRGKL